LAPSDFHLFDWLKNELGGKRFDDDDDDEEEEEEEVETEVQKMLRQQSKDFYAAGFDTMAKRWGKYINACGGHVEKCFFQVRI
jgi:hypothetical protein